MLTGHSIGELQLELIVLGAIALGTLLLSVLMMRRQAYTA